MGFYDDQAGRWVTSAKGDESAARKKAATEHLKTGLHTYERTAAAGDRTSVPESRAARQMCALVNGGGDPKAISSVLAKEREERGMDERDNPQLVEEFAQEVDEGAEEIMAAQQGVDFIMNEPEEPYLEGAEDDEEGGAEDDDFDDDDDDFDSEDFVNWIEEQGVDPAELWAELEQFDKAEREQLLEQIEAAYEAEFGDDEDGEWVDEDGNPIAEEDLDQYEIADEGDDGYGYEDDDDYDAGADYDDADGEDYAGAYESAGYEGAEGAGEE